MLDLLPRELAISNTAAALLLVLIVAQLGTQAYALVDLARRDRVRGRKWVWVLVIVIGGLVGAAAYAVVGRAEPEVGEAGRGGGVSSGGGEAARRAVDTLYGSRS